MQFTFIFNQTKQHMRNRIILMLATSILCTCSVQPSTARDRDVGIHNKDKFTKPEPTGVVFELAEYQKVSVLTPAPAVEYQPTESIYQPLTVSVTATSGHAIRQRMPTVATGTTISTSANLHYSNLHIDPGLN